ADIAAENMAVEDPNRSEHRLCEPNVGPPPRFVVAKCDQKCAGSKSG
ncbi:hypothetical protein L195_g044391, partial [Trifolium pratense]